DRFRADPQRFLGGAREGHGAPAPAPPPSGKVEYYCPMDPEVVSDRPGSCPKCGMALEPRTVTADEGPNPELIDMTRRFWVGLGFSVPLVVLAMSHWLPAWAQVPHEWEPALNWVQMALAIPVVFWCGWPFFQRAGISVVQRSPNMFTLIALGVSAAFFY